MLARREWRGGRDWCGLPSDLAVTVGDEGVIPGEHPRILAHTTVTSVGVEGRAAEGSSVIGAKAKRAARKLALASCMDRAGSRPGWVVGRGR